MGFGGDLIVRHVDETTWFLDEDLVYLSEAGRTFTVPTGTETDFASIPRFAWAVLPPTGRWGRAAVLHDFLYARKIVSREGADHLFLEAMRSLGVAWWKRRTMWLAVRAFGGAAYGKGVWKL